MSLHPQHPIPPVPDETARIARAAFPKGSVRARANQYRLSWGKANEPFGAGVFRGLFQVEHVRALLGPDIRQLDPRDLTRGASAGKESN